MGEYEMRSGDETSPRGKQRVFWDFFFSSCNDRVVGSWILFSSAIQERSKAWTAPSVGPVFISGAALQHWG